MLTSVCHRLWDFPGALEGQGEPPNNLSPNQRGQRGPFREDVTMASLPNQEMLTILGKGLILSFQSPFQSAPTASFC